jgi:hypothetical protein
MPGSRHWVFTTNNYTSEDEDCLQELGEGDRTEYLCYGRETGDSGTPHLQGYIIFTSRKTLSQVRRLVRRSHLEKAKGSPRQCKEYCEKDGDFYEWGDCPSTGRGKRNDLHELWQKAKDGVSLKALSDSHGTSFIKYYRGVERVRTLHSSTRQWATEVYVFWGPTGTGKTKRAFELCSDPYVHSGSSWFDGYDGQGDVIFDDFGGSEFKLTYLLKLLDRYPMQVPIKGSFVQWKPKRVFITANYHPDDWYPNAKPEHKAALKRRISVIDEARETAEGTEWITE